MDKLPKVIVLTVDDAIVSTGVFKSLLYERARLYRREGLPLAAAQFDAIANSARLLDLDAMAMHPAPGKTYTDLHSGYNEALREVAGLNGNSESSEG